MSEFTCFRCGDGNTPLYCLNCADEIAKNEAKAQAGSVATCGKCGKAMRYNVPRLGPAGGFVHADTGSPMCAKETAVEAQRQSELPAPAGSTIAHIGARIEREKQRIANAKTDDDREGVSYLRGFVNALLWVLEILPDEKGKP